MKKESLWVNFAVLVMILISTVPFLYVLVFSFLSDNNSITFRYYYDVFLGDPQYTVRFWRSIGLCLCIVAGQIVVSVLAAYGFAKFSFKGKNVLLFVLVILVILPLQVTLTPNHFIFEKFGLLNTYSALIFPSVFVPLGTFILIRSFGAVSNVILDAARLDGCSLISLLTRIILPMNASGLVCVILLSFLDSWNMVEQPIAYLNEFERYPISVALAFVPPGAPGLRLVCCVLVIIPPLFLFTCFNRELVEGIVLAEVK